MDGCGIISPVLLIHYCYKLQVTSYSTYLDFGGIPFPLPSPLEVGPHCAAREYGHGRPQGQTGSADSPGKTDEKLKSENMQKRAVFYVYVIF